MVHLNLRATWDDNIIRQFLDDKDDQTLNDNNGQRDMKCEDDPTLDDQILDDNTFHQSMPLNNYSLAGNRGRRMVRG